MRGLDGIDDADVEADADSDAGADSGADAGDDPEAFAETEVIPR